MKPRLTLLAGACVLALSTIASAAPPPGIHERMNHMETRIERGIRSGDLTREESQRLRQELREIKRREDRMREDGRLSDRERAKLHEELDRLDRHIMRERRDDQRRGDGRR